MSSITDFLSLEITIQIGFIFLIALLPTFILLLQNNRRAMKRGIRTGQKMENKKWTDLTVYEYVLEKKALVTEGKLKTTMK